MLKKSGFTIVEVIIVVAVLSVIVAIGLPSYNTYVVRSKQAEAQANLGNIYTSMKNYYAQFVGYTPRFDAIGYRPTGEMTYRVGFSADFAPPATAVAQGYAGTGTCIDSVAILDNAATWNGTVDSCTNAYVPSWTNSTRALNAPGNQFHPVTTDTFTVAAIAQFSSFGGATIDSWSINEFKEVKH